MLNLAEFIPKSELRTTVTRITSPKFPVIDVHSHFGPLLLGDDYALIYDTGRTVEKLRLHGVRNIVNLDLIWDSALEKMLEKTKTEGEFILTFASLDVTKLEEDSFDEYVERTLLRYKNKGVRGLKFWKNIGLALKDKKGRFIRIDDNRLHVVWRICAELDMPVLIHIADPIAFFKPADGQNEQYEALIEHPEWSFARPGMFSFEELMNMQEKLLTKNPRTTFIIAHVGSCAENLAYVAESLDRFPNMYVDIAARINELGRQPYTSRKFFNDYQDRILFGTDFCPDEQEHLYPYYYRFLETYDEYFDYCDSAVPELGRWKIYGIGLDDTVLEQVYWKNAARMLRLGNDFA